MLVDRTTPVLRAAASTLTRPLHTSAPSRHLSSLSPSRTRSSPSPLSATTLFPSPALSTSLVRHASSSAAPAASTASQQQKKQAGGTLTWNQWLQLRKTRRRYNLVASGATGLGTAFTGASYLAGMDLNQLSTLLFGLDPVIALGLSTAACGALGWLIGPTAGNAVFNMTHKTSGPEMLAKEKSFYHRIAKYRADIAVAGNAQSTPFPDYYGEKIDSVAAYKQWLRDQRKFAKKREYRA